MPPGTRTLTVPITISMKARRRSCAVLFACVDSTDTTGKALADAEVERDDSRRQERLRDAP